MRIEAVDVSVVINGREIIRRESLVCRPGTMTALVGPSGSGKATLLHCLGLLQKPSGGRVSVDGVDTTGWGAAKRRRFWRDHAAFVLPDYGVMETESVAYNVTMSASLLGSRIRGDRQRLRTALEQTGLTGRDDEAASYLSGGEKQRLAVARAIYRRAQVVLVDEPTASLDEANRRRVIDLLAGRAGEGCTVIVATHDDEMIEACDVRHAVGRQLIEASAEH
jgi:putative ABC transport system ATP-binding protein